MSVLINNNGTLDPVAGNGIKNTFTGTTAEVEQAIQAGLISDGTVIYITDDNSSVDANDVAYDNTSSGLTATNVQAGLDEVKNVLDGINSDLSDIESALTNKAPSNQGVKSTDITVTITGTHNNLVLEFPSSNCAIVSIMPLSNNIGIVRILKGMSNSNNAYFADFEDNQNNPVTTGTVTCRVFYTGILS